MKKRIFTLQNKGMNRDLSISKAGESSAYENHNIRILAREHDTMLSVTNERGNKEISLTEDISGVLIGWNILNKYLVLFSHDLTGENPDHIYRVEYTPGDEEHEFVIVELFVGDLEFSEKNPIESVVYYESENIQKIYWVDGKNVLRMMNFADDSMPWYDSQTQTYDSTYFDSNRNINFTLSVKVEKDNSGNSRANGTIQYLITYFNKFSQETGYAWISDLIYLSPTNAGGSPDGYNTNRIKLNISNADTRFTNINVYSIFRSSYDGTVTAYLVKDVELSNDSSDVVVIDDGAHLTAVDASSLLYLGSRDVRPGTITHKDQTLFLGDLDCNDQDLETLAEEIRGTMFAVRDPQDNSLVQTEFVDGTTWESYCVSFEYSEGNALISNRIAHIPYVANNGAYPYENQLLYSSSTITTFKGGEKYRFGLMFRSQNGVNTQTFWIGDKINYLYPVTKEAGKYIKRAIAKCLVPSSVMQEAYRLGMRSVQLMIAEATYADRSIKAQGLLNPTVFNVWNRYNNRLYASPSWISRPRNSGYACNHFDVIHKSNTSTGEIQCNYWDTESTPTPYYRYKDYTAESPEYLDEFEGMSEFDEIMMLYSVCWNRLVSGRVSGHGIVAVGYALKIKYNDENGRDEFANLDLTQSQYDYLFQFDRSANYTDGLPKTYILEGDGFRLVACNTGLIKGGNINWEEKAKSVMMRLNVVLQSQFDINNNAMLLEEDTFMQWCNEAYDNGGDWYHYNRKFASVSDAKQTINAAANERWDQTADLRWFNASGISRSTSGAERPSYYKKHLMFVDENTVTLDSPEITYEAVSFDKVDGLKLRVIGVSRVDSNISDADVYASHAMLPGKNFVDTNLSGVGRNAYLDGLTAWPLWDEYGLTQKADDSESGYEFPENPKERSSKDFLKKPGLIARYWLYMWNHLGQIDDFYKANEDGSDSEQFSLLRSKMFANMKFSYKTSYVYTGDETIGGWTSDLESLRLFNYTSSQYLSIKTNDKNVYYDGYVDEMLLGPDSFKYPIYYNNTDSSVGKEIRAQSYYMFSDSPVPITYASNPHAVITLPTIKDGSVYSQTILPRVSNDSPVVIPTVNAQTHESGALIPWFDVNDYMVNYVTSNTYSYYYSWVATDNSQQDRVSLKLDAHPIQSAGGPIGPDGIAELDIIDKVWNKGMEYFGAGELYVLISARVSSSSGSGFSVSRFLVDISGYTVDETGYILTIQNAKCVRATVKDTVNANYAVFDDASGVPSSTGSGVLDLHDGSITSSASGYSYTDYTVNYENEFTLNPNNANSSDVDADPSDTDKYYLVGEIYQDFDSDPLNDPRYGGIHENDVINNKFIASSRLYRIREDSSLAQNCTLYGDRGDTYFQRFDALRIKPLDKESENSVIDITSAMLETHINIDGRYDLQRGTMHLASINTEQFGVLNRVYSQPDNFITGRDVDDDLNNELYHSSITWTLEKHDMSSVDEWTHITLTNNLKLDGDKGWCRALRRFQNSLIAFQDKGIAEILFNSRTQIATTNGVPIEIANSGKVDGKRYITNKYGCLNKWSIVEGKAGLYFVDNINKMFGKLADGIDNLAARLGFSAFFREINDIEPWNPDDFNNIVAYYDRIHSDIYLVRKDTTLEQDSKQCDCLVYNETIGAFTSFFDYGSTVMMTNLEDRFVSSRDGKLWLQNEGLYCNFFDNQYDFWTTYRATPDPYGDKLWTNIEYRADVYEALDAEGTMLIDESDLIDDRYYLADETFDTLSVWNEYQRTNEVTIAQRKIDFYSDVRKKFRIWRMDIPRAIATESNKFGFDRIRNPWVNIKFKKGIDASIGENQNLMQIHDMNVIYFE